MTDIAVSTSTFLPADRPWLLFEGVGHQAPTSTTFGLLDFALFTSGTHFPNGFLPSGLVLGRVTTGGRLGPYDAVETDGRETAVGILYNATSVPADLTRKVAVAIIDCFAVITEARLPSGHGLDAAARVDLPLIKFRA